MVGLVCHRGEPPTFWPALAETIIGAMLGGWRRPITAVVLMILGPTIWLWTPSRKYLPYEYFRRCFTRHSRIRYFGTDNSYSDAEPFRAQFIRSDWLREQAARINSRSLDREFLQNISSWLPAAKPIPLQSESIGDQACNALLADQFI